MASEDKLFECHINLDRVQSATFSQAPPESPPPPPAAPPGIPRRIPNPGGDASRIRVTAPMMMNPGGGADVDESGWRR